jgi:hypothetical protein
MRRGGSPYNALSEGYSLGGADPPQEDEGMGDNTEMGTLAVTEELHAKQQEAARKEAAARKAPQCLSTPPQRAVPFSSGTLDGGTVRITSQAFPLDRFTGHLTNDRIEADYVWHGLAKDELL